MADWQVRRGCAGLAQEPAGTEPVGFHASVARVTPFLRERMASSRHPAARDVVGVFRQLYDARWPIRRWRLVDAYGGSDDRSMAADNTSAFNCRAVDGSRRWSDHAFGAAIDLNPAENPYLTASSVAPPGSGAFAALDRSAGAAVPAGVITSGDVVVRAFAAIGWEWGGSWADPDFQHFSSADGPRVWCDERDD